MTDLDFQQRQDRLEKFSEKLSLLMTEYGVDLSSTGGVYVYSDEQLAEAKLLNEKIVVDRPDASSGDLETSILVEKKVT
jgi:hypothetical protein